jgi:DNA polymerase I
MCSHLPFREVWAVDFEFGQDSNLNPEVRCMVARELRSRRTLRLWYDELHGLTEAPFSCGAGALFIAYYSSAELGCFLSLGWSLPVNVADLFVEFRCATNGTLGAKGAAKLTGALSYFGLDAVSATEKEEMRGLAIHGGPEMERRRSELLAYCETDVDALEALLPRLLPAIDLPHALLRGRYMKAAAVMERRGIPIDVETLEALRARWGEVKRKLVLADRFGVYEGTSFRVGRFEQLLAERGYVWPRLETGALNLRDETFRQMARVYPALNELRELRTTLAKLRLEKLAVGADGRNRTLLSAFAARTGRNAPSNSRSVFGPSTWIRHLVKPAKGRAVAYLDWSSQEFAIAAAISGDQNMIDAYLSGDPYICMARLAGKAPPDATKQTHGSVRDVFKVVSLATAYGMGPKSLGAAAAVVLPEAQEILLRLRESFPVFHRFATDTTNRAMLGLPLTTSLGWKIRASGVVKPGTFRNFLMQGAGAEMLRLAAIFTTEAGLPVCWPVHDALVVEAAVSEIDDVVDATRSVMERASEAITGGLRVRVDAKVVRWPGRFSDPRGEGMWRVVSRLLAESVEAAADREGEVGRGETKRGGLGGEGVFSSLREQEVPTNQSISDHQDEALGTHEKQV